MPDKITEQELDTLRRLAKGRSTEDVAREIGVSWHSLYYWLKGTRRPSRMAAGRIRAYLVAKGAEKAPKNAFNAF